MPFATGRGQQSSTGCLPTISFWCTEPLCYAKPWTEIIWPLNLGEGVQREHRTAVSGLYKWKTRANHQMDRFDSAACTSLESGLTLPGKVTGLLWFKADDKCNQVESSAETCNLEMIENGLVVVTAMYELTKQQTYMSVTLDDSFIWTFPSLEAGMNVFKSFLREQERNLPWKTLDSNGLNMNDWTVFSCAHTFL